MEISATITDSHLIYSNDAKEHLRKFISDNEGKDIILKYEPIKDIKSYEQLKFYFGVLIPAFVSHTGDTNKSMFDAYLRDKYLSSLHEINGEQFKYVPSLQIGKNKVTKEKMTWYIEQCLNELCDVGGNIDGVIVEEYRNRMLGISEDQPSLFNKK